MTSPLRVHLLPIEPFEERYTAQWRRWWPAELQAAGAEVLVHDGDADAARERTGGEFLDPADTWIWKGSQVAAFARAFRLGLVQDGDWVLSLDGWGPATEAAAYLRETTGRRIRLATFFHAGSYDPHDFLARAGCRRWALDVERGWMRAADVILVGSRFHAQLIRDQLFPGIPRGELPRIAATGYPIHRAELRALAREAGVDATAWAERPRRVVFPHRLAPEKQPELFDAIRARHAELYPDTAPTTHWLRTRDDWRGKAHYYGLLASARVAVSTALQETFGIAMQEAAALGCYLVAPRRLSYPEVVRPGSGLCYDTLDHAAHLIEAALLDGRRPSTWDGYHERAIGRAAEVLRARSGVGRGV